MLASAGIECQVRAPGAYSLPPAVDALLAWAVREGATNIVRHAAARHAEIVIELTGAEASACLSDDGAGPRKDSVPAVAGTEGPDAVAGAPASGVAGGTDGGSALAGLAGPVAGSGSAGLAGPVTGSGLAGLAERAARLGGTLSAGAGERGGFRLRVSVLLTGPAAATEADVEPGRERMPS